MLDNFCKENNLDTIVDLLMAKGSDVLDIYDLTEYTNVTNENIDFPVVPGETCNMKIIEIFSNLGIAEKTQNIFAEEISLLNQIDNLQRALYIFISPHSVIPSHIDNDDESFRIVTGVMTPNVDKTKLGLVIDKDFIQLQSKQTIGIAAPKVWHHGWNYTDQYWSMLTLCIKDNKFDDIRKIY
jgi:hypothetical protein